VENIGITRAIDMQALAQKLKDLNVPEGYYSLGHVRNERTCLVEIDGRWAVFFSEKGRMEDLHFFDSLGEAGIYLLGVLNDGSF
jgi:hypothetical protein